MIPRINVRAPTPRDVLSDILGSLGQFVSVHEGLTRYTVVGHWPGLDCPELDPFTFEDGVATWTAAQWAEHLEEPLLENPSVTGPQKDRRAIFHIEARLHPDDRDLSGAEWAEAAHRLARTAGIQTPGDEKGCRWIAVRSKPGRLDLFANLIRLDGTWQQEPTRLIRRLVAEARRIEEDLRLVPSPPAESEARAVPGAAVQLANVLAQLADAQSGPLATVRGLVATARNLVEHTAQRIARQPAGHASPDTAHRLELIARRLHGIQQDLDTTAAGLTPARPAAAAVPPAVRRSARRSL
ncbi:relaxase/mobilization nuclease [Streptomyces sp. NPDC059096]|uniref:relaxase/mobilization nuclease n=1 Tax=Streptomyces sp. NPDC059096 TaxID=3346727 RepID=UPI0036A114C5